MNLEVVQSNQEEAVIDTVSILPGVGILGVFSYLNYEPWFALAEFVDNALQSSIQSYDLLTRINPLYRLKVDISYEREDGGSIVVSDNAAGIARSDFDRAFKAADIPPDRSGLSEFGMGMKSASIWFAKNWRVITTSVGDPNIYTVDFDIDAILKEKSEHIRVSSVTGKSNDHFTRIELRNLNQHLHGRTLGKVRDHLREIYRMFLRQKRLSLTVAGQQMEYTEPEFLQAVDYRFVDAEDPGVHEHIWKKQVDVTLESGVKISGWAALRAEGKTTGNGLSLFRRSRLIVGTEDAPYRPPRIFGQPNSYRSQRLFGELTVQGLSVSHTKDGFQWHDQSEEFEETLRRVLDEEPLPLLKQAENYRARQASRIEQKRIQEATESTAKVSEAVLPSVLPQVVQDAREEPEILGANTGDEMEVTRQFSFVHDRTNWTVTITATSRAGEPRWLVRHIDSDPRSNFIHASLTINTAHRFITQFALGSTDALESVFRMAVALVVSESLLTTAGDGETAGVFMRQVNTLLTEALSKRMKSGDE